MHKIISSRKRRQQQSHPGQSGSIDRPRPSAEAAARSRRRCSERTLPGNRPPSLPPRTSRAAVTTQPNLILCRRLFLYTLSAPCRVIPPQPPRYYSPSITNPPARTGLSHPRRTSPHHLWSHQPKSR